MIFSQIFEFIGLVDNFPSILISDIMNDVKSHYLILKKYIPGSKYYGNN